MQQTLKSKTAVSPTVARRPLPPSWRNSRTTWLVILVVIVGWSLAQAGLWQRDLVNEGGWTLALRFVRASIHPDLSPDFLQLTAAATLTTLAYAVTGTALSWFIGSIGGILVSESWWRAVLPGRYRRPWIVTRAVLAFPRGIHELLWGLFFINIFGLDPLTAILAIAIPYGAIIAKVFAETIDETAQRPYDALLNSGVSPLRAFFYSLVPQAFPDLLSYGFYRFECAIRAAAVLGIIGAGGLGYQILLSLQTLRYEEMWTLFLALFLLSGLADYWSAWLRRRLGRPGCTCTGLEGEPMCAPQAYGPQRDRVLKGSLWAATVLLPFSFWYVQADFSKLWSPRTAVLLTDIAHAAWPPRVDWNQIVTLVRLSGLTLSMSVLAAVLAAGLGLLLAFPAASNLLLPGGVLAANGESRWRRWWGTAVVLFTRALLLVSRAIPAPIWALVLLYVLFPGILPGAIALALYNLGVLGRLLAEVIENLDERPLHALKAQGASGLQLFLYGVLPATMSRFIAYSLYRWEIAIRATVIVGLVGAGGLGRLLTEQLSSFDYRGVTLTLAFYIGLTFLVDLVSSSMRKAWR